MAYISFQPSDYFNTKLYTGNGSTNAITGVGFQPDWVWVKNRTDASTNHLVTDAVRGATKCLFPNLTNAEVTEANALQSFNSDGFTLGSDSSVNTNTKNWVSWNWKANGAGSSNTDGSITSTVSANTTSGFSIVKYTGTGSAATIGHGLGVAPKMIIAKNLGDARSWGVYHASLGATQPIDLDGSGAAFSSSTYWNNTSPTTSVFSTGGGNNTGSAFDFIAYCFAEKKGFSKFGSYAGNANVDGPFVYTGFKPAFVVVKKIGGATANWVMTDNKISFNGKGTNNSTVLFPSTSAAESDAYGLMLHSNGFKFSGSDSASATVNGSGATYIYMAFAEAPLVSSNGVPAVAR
jgi:hypothetical protein